MNQGNLFSGADAYGQPIVAPSRQTDPASSKAAAVKVARSGKLAGNAAIVLAILKRHGRPATYREIYAMATTAEQQALREAVTVMRRLDTLAKRGLVIQIEPRECAASGNLMCAWEVTE